jgi:multidrug efflux system membrane fusion protein
LEALQEPGSGFPQQADIVSGGLKTAASRRFMVRVRAPRFGPRSLFALAACLAMALLFSSCSRKPAGAQGRPGAGAAVPVLVAKAESRDIPVEIHAIGSVQAYSVVSIRSQITGPITEVHFQEGQEVRDGDPLFTIDPRPYEAALNQAKSSLIRDEAQLVSARLEFERTSNLFVSKIASRQDYDTAEANYRALEGTVLVDQAAISNAQVSLGYTVICAPIDGRTGDVTAKKGNVVKAPDDVLLTITQVHPIYVAFSVPEQNLAAIRRKSSQDALAVEAVVPSQRNSLARGELTFINNMVDTNTGTILLKGTFANTNDVLWPGQFVQVSLTLSNLVQATVVPSQAVQTGQNGEFVFVVKPDQTVEAHPVATSVSYDGLTVITSGVQPDETVVTDGQLRLVPGAKVSARSSPTPAPATNPLENPQPQR